MSFCLRHHSLHHRQPELCYSITRSLNVQCHHSCPQERDWDGDPPKPARHRTAPYLGLAVPRRLDLCLLVQPHDTAARQGHRQRTERVQRRPGVPGRLPQPARPRHHPGRLAAHRHRRQCRDHQPSAAPLRPRRAVHPARHPQRHHPRRQLPLRDPLARRVLRRRGRRRQLLPSVGPRSHARRPLRPCRRLWQPAHPLHRARLPESHHH
mmetsp:Transcript_71286/g.190327  ORF Transcript_71286/g.190327 Transcript_71286/m.190327 type:complete len:209 (-) Transcript_71286:208-834(-)